MRLSFHDPYNAPAYVKINGRYTAPMSLFFGTVVPPFIIALVTFVLFFQTGVFWLLIPAILVGAILVYLFLSWVFGGWAAVLRSGRESMGRPQ